MPLRVLFVDMNAYFASVEQQEVPHLRGRPVAVAAVDTDSTSCIAVSYEAKKSGIKGGTPVGLAKQLCPRIRIVTARPRLYVDYHHRIRNAIESCLPIGHADSIDEFWCPLSDRERTPPPARVLAQQVKRAIATQVGQFVRCSIGLAPNRFLAKVASDMQKPDGLTVITCADLPRILYPMKLDELAGIGSRMRVRLESHRIFTVEQLCAASKEQLVKVWGGVIGEYWWRWLRGEDVAMRDTHRRTLGHSHVLPPKYRTMEGAKSVFMRLIHRAAARLRQEGYWAQWMEVYISFSRHEEGWQARVPLGLCQDTLSVIQSFNAIWAFCPAGGQPRQVAITFLGLVSNAYAPAPLFPAEQHRVRLAQAMDRLNERLGANTIYFAGMNEALETAPTRIAFTRIPTLNDPDFEGSPARAGLVSHPPALFLLPKNIRRSRSSAEWWRH